MTFVYRCFDKENKLLYIGVSDWVKYRMLGHKRYSRWFPLMDRTTETIYETRNEALAAEVLAIRSERPLFNIAHTGLAMEDLL